jgi:hypothetical protein
VALRAHEALVLARVDANVALACKEYVWTPIFIASEPHHGLVGSYQPRY